MVLRAIWSPGVRLIKPRNIIINEIAAFLIKYENCKKKKKMNFVPVSQVSTQAE